MKIKKKNSYAMYILIDLFIYFIDNIAEKKITFNKKCSNKKKNIFSKFFLLQKLSQNYFKNQHEHK